METMTSDDVQLDTVLPALKSCPLFQALKDDHFSQILKISDVVRFAGEEVMVSEGTDADAFYVIIEGDAVIRLSSPAGEDVDVGKIPTGASFGEVGLLLGQKRTASVVALNNLTALKFSQKAFDTMFQKIPRFGVGLSRGLAHRLDEISGQIPLPKYDTRKGAPGTDVLNLIPKEFCQRHRVMPLEVDGNVLTVGVVDDPTTAIVTALRQHVPGMELHTVRAELPVLQRSDADAFGDPDDHAGCRQRRVRIEAGGLARAQRSIEGNGGRRGLGFASLRWAQTTLAHQWRHARGRGRPRRRQESSL